MSDDIAREMDNLDKECVDYKNVYESLLEQRKGMNMDTREAKSKLEELSVSENFNNVINLCFSFMNVVLARGSRVDGRTQRVDEGRRESSKGTQRETR